MFENLNIVKPHDECSHGKTHFYLSHQIFCNNFIFSGCLNILLILRYDPLTKKNISLGTKKIFQIMFNKQQTAMKTGSTILQVVNY